MNPEISVVIPNYNGATTLENCLEAVLASVHPSFEVVVVDDGSDDNSIDIIRRFPCRLIRLEKHRGASAARNAGAYCSRGEMLFFTDADCVLRSNTLLEAQHALCKFGPHTVLGGTYEQQSYDPKFFSGFQSVFIHYSESKYPSAPDYIASHAMAIYKTTFTASGGFKEQWLPILEDVEFSHRLRRTGYRLYVDPNVLVRHIFNFSLKKSIVNAIKKSSYWTLYSINNKDLLRDSGTASHELKSTVLLFHTVLLCLILAVLKPNFFLVLACMLLITNFFLNRNLLKAFYTAYGLRFSIAAAVYYFFVYPLPVTIGSFIGLTKYLRTPRTQWTAQ